MRKFERYNSNSGNSVTAFEYNAGMKRFMMDSGGQREPAPGFHTCVCNHGV